MPEVAVGILVGGRVTLGVVEGLVTGQYGSIFPEVFGIVEVVEVIVRGVLRNPRLHDGVGEGGYVVAIFLPFPRVVHPVQTHVLNGAARQVVIEALSDLLGNRDARPDGFVDRPLGVDRGRQAVLEELAAILHDVLAHIAQIQVERALFIRGIGGGETRVLLVEEGGKHPELDELDVR